MPPEIVFDNLTDGKPMPGFERREKTWYYKGDKIAGDYDPPPSYIKTRVDRKGYAMAFVSRTFVTEEDGRLVFDVKTYLSIRDGSGEEVRIDTPLGGFLRDLERFA